MAKDLIDNEIILRNESLQTLIIDLAWIFVELLGICIAFYMFVLSIKEMHLIGFVFSILGMLSLSSDILFQTIILFRKVKINKEGYEIKLFHLKKFYYWKNVCTKKCENFEYNNKHGVDYPKVKRNVFFSEKSIKKSSKKSPNDYFRLHIFDFSFFSILLTDIETVDEKNFSVNYYRVDERLFKKKMREWNIEVEGL